MGIKVYPQQLDSAFYTTPVGCGEYCSGSGRDASISIASANYRIGPVVRPVDQDARTKK